MEKPPPTERFIRHKSLFRRHWMHPGTRKPSLLTIELDR